MIRLFRQWRALHREYRAIVPLSRDLTDIVSAILITIGTGALSLGLAAVLESFL